MLKKNIRQIFARLGIGIYRLDGRYVEDGLMTVHDGSFRADERFRDAYQRGVRASGGVDPHFEWRVHTALWAGATSLRVEGDFVECGVNAGFMSSAIMRWLNWNSVGRCFYLIDTFAGPVLEQFCEGEVTLSRQEIALSALRAGAYVTDIERIRANFAEWPSAVVVQGAVPDVLHTVPFEQVAFLHIDMNCAFPEQAALEFFWERLSPGGMVLLDDYAFYGHTHQRNAIDGAARRFGRSVLAFPTGQGLLVR